MVSAHAASSLWIAIASALTLIAGIGLAMCFASLGFGWHIPLPRSRIRLLPGEHVPAPPPVRGLGQGLGEIMDQILQSIPPLSMKLEAQEWELWQDWIWIGSLKIRITNNTDRVMRLRNFSLDPDLGSYTPPKPNQEQADALFHEVLRRGDTYTSHIRMMDLEPDDSISGWFVRWVSMSEDGGRPPCMFVVTDAASDTYELPIPARERRSHILPGADTD